jgi:hypothetical protein
MGTEATGDLLLPENQPSPRGTAIEERREMEPGPKVSARPPGSDMYNVFLKEQYSMMRTDT